VSVLEGISFCTEHAAHIHLSLCHATLCTRMLAGCRFNAKNACTSRRYAYILPTCVLMPPAEVAAVFAEASEWHSAQQQQQQTDSDSTTATADTTSAATADSTADATVDGDAAAADITDIELLLDDETATPEEIALAQEAARRRQAYVSNPAVIKRAAEKLKAFRISAETLTKLRDTLGLFAGVHNYHNYTIRCVLPCISRHTVSV
jgi:tRNA U38,U39,U40 pseudouridine synthase TruA